jgi:hypothetical protein
VPQTETQPWATVVIITTVAEDGKSCKVATIDLDTPAQEFPCSLPRNDTTPDCSGVARADVAHSSTSPPSQKRIESGREKVMKSKGPRLPERCEHTPQGLRLI